MDELDGAYSLVLMSAQKLIAARDPFGFRPLCYGRLSGGGDAVGSDNQVGVCGAPRCQQFSGPLPCQVHGYSVQHRVGPCKIDILKNTEPFRKLVLVDDSIVRGTTSGRIVKLLREAGAKEIHLRVSSPPFLHPCYYGTDIDSQDNLIACRHSRIVRVHQNSPASGWPVLFCCFSLN